MAVIANPEAGELFTLDREERQRVVGSCKRSQGAETRCWPAWST